MEKQFKNDWKAEREAIKAYNNAIKLCIELDANETRNLLEEILKDKENHIDWIETQFDQIQQMEMQNYLSEQR